ncbi:MAG: ABC transporter substrate-binding protein [Burkholderiales bacterium]|nr:ABC transporter substrate-binding protein [Burkholderiales bacterium]
MKPRHLIPAFLVSLAIACAAWPAAAADKVKVVALQGTQLFPVRIMQSRGIAAKHGIEMDLMVVASPQASYTAMQTGDPNVGFTGWIVIALLREKGFKLTNVYSMNGYTNDVMVKLDSPIKSMADLKGRRVGLFGGANSATTWLYRLVTQKFYGFDSVKEARAHYGAPPLLLGMLDKGELDAILTLDPFLSQMLESGKYRSVGSIGEIWQQKMNQSPMLVSVTVNETWAKANPEVTRRFVAAFREALIYLKDTPAAWTELAKAMGIKSERGAKIMYDRTAPALITRFDKKLIDEQLAYAAELYKTFGKQADIPERVPEGTFDLSYVR